MREELVKTRIKKYLDALGIWYYMPAGSVFGKAGIPDFIGCIPPDGRLIGIEAKGKGGVLSEKQGDRRDEIRAHGGIWLLIDHKNITMLPLYIQAAGIPINVSVGKPRHPRPKR